MSQILSTDNDARIEMPDTFKGKVLFILSEMVDLLLVAHGGGHNDTICLAERKRTAVSDHRDGRAGDASSDPAAVGGSPAHCLMPRGSCWKCGQPDDIFSMEGIGWLCVDCLEDERRADELATYCPATDAK